jgi:fructuronate reductase
VILDDESSPADRRPRLSLATLPSAGPEAIRPLVDPRGLRIGLMHFGIGAFHRAHQAVFTEIAAAATGSDQWGIAASTQRSATVRDQLAPQDGLYTVLDRGQEGTSLRIIGSIREVLDGGGDPDGVVARIVDPAVQVITLTVTEKGYRRSSTGALDVTDPLVAADLAGAPPRTAVGQLVRGLLARSLGSGAPVTVLSCDNLVGNGFVLGGLVREFIERLPAVEQGPLLDWLASSVSFPSSMVDRIVPATTAEDRAEVLARLQLEDQGTVVAEPFRQWVIEDDFAAARPAWELAGAVLTADVAPWETAKLRLLNGTHSALAYLGGLRGYRTIAEAIGDPELATVAESLMKQDVIPTLVAPPGLDLEVYAASVLERFANPALRHTTAQVAMDGSQKLPLRLLGTVRERLAAGAVPHWATLAVAGWMVYVATRRDRNGQELTLNDPLAAELMEAVGSAGSPASIVDRLLALPGIFAGDLVDHREWREELVSAVAGLQKELGRPEN